MKLQGQISGPTIRLRLGLPPNIALFVMRQLLGGRGIVATMSEKSPSARSLGRDDDQILRHRWRVCEFERSDRRLQIILVGFWVLFSHVA
jgi:hypothetical protein